MIVALLRDAYAGLRTPLSVASVSQWAQSCRRAAPSQRTYTVHFGSWVAACDAAGVPHAHEVADIRPGPRPVSIEECWSALASFMAYCRSHGLAPTMDQYQLLSRERGWPTRNTITLRLDGTWRELVGRADGMDLWTGPIRTPHPRRERERPPTASEILTALQAAAEANSGRITVADYRMWAAGREVPQPDAIRARFGSWSLACRAAGVMAGRSGWTALEVIEQLQRAYDQIGEPFTVSRFARWVAAQPPPVVHLKPDTAIRLLTSWSMCHEAAMAGAATTTA